MTQLQLVCVLFIVSCWLITMVHAGSAFSFRRPLRFISNNKSLAVTSISTVDIPKDTALDEFRTSVKNLGSESESDMSVMTCWDASMSALVDHYNTIFPTRCAAYTTKEEFVAEQRMIVNECRARMRVFQQEVEHLGLSYEIYLLELEGDLGDFISKLTVEEVSAVKEVKQMSRWQLWRSTRWFQRCKWIATQALMLAYNFGQYDVHRRLAKRAAEKRLAEVPEFPLL